MESNSKKKFEDTLEVWLILGIPIVWKEPVYSQPSETMHLEFVFIQFFLFSNFLLAFPQQSSIEDDIFGNDYPDDYYSALDDAIFAEKCSEKEGYR